MSSAPTWVVATHAVLPNGPAHRLVTALQTCGHAVALRGIPLLGASRRRSEQLLPGATEPEVLADIERTVAWWQELASGVDMGRFAWDLARYGSRDVILVGCDAVSFLLASAAATASPLSVRRRAVWFVDWSAQRLDGAVSGLAYRMVTHTALAIADVAAAISPAAAGAVAAQARRPVGVLTLPNLPLRWPLLVPWDRRPPGVVYVGGLSEHQGVSVLLGAAATLAAEGVQVDIAGGGPASHRVAAEVAHIPGVRFHGLLSGTAELAGIMDRARVGWALYDPTYPMHAYVDSLKIKDYLSAGLRVVSTLSTSVADGVIAKSVYSVPAVVAATRRLLSGDPPTAPTEHPMLTEAAQSLRAFVDSVGPGL